MSLIDDVRDWLYKNRRTEAEKIRFMEELRQMFRYGYVGSNADDDKITEIRIDCIIKCRGDKDEN